MFVEPGEKRGCVVPLNNAMKALNLTGVDTIGFINDDMEFVEKDWERQLLAVRDAGAKVIFGERNKTSAGMGNFPFIDARMPAALGFLAPPHMVHLYVDDFWQEVGRQLNSITYLEKPIIIHNHPIHGKRQWDDLTKELNSPERYHEDYIGYSRYMSLDFQTDMVKIREALK